MTAQPKMNQSERNAMVKVVKGRFEAVRRYAMRLRDDLKTAIFNRVVDDNKRKIEAAERDMAKIEQRAEKLKEDARAIVEKHEAEGVILGHASIDWRWTQTRDERVKVVDAQRVKFDDVMKFDVYNRWFVRDVDKQVEREYREVEREHGLGELALAKKEQELIEEILLGGVNPDAAREFLERVPTLDALPAVEEIRRLPSGS